MKPILFNSKMVMAILEGRKTVTRRLMKPQPKPGVTQLHKIPKGQMFPGCFGSMESNAVHKPPFREGDILYVRETWQQVYETEWTPDGVKNIRELISNFDAIPKVEAGISDEHKTAQMDSRMKYFVFAASNIESASDDNRIMWRPSIHMPKEAARIFLRVTRVSAQPLQWCGNAQAKDEGCTCCAQFVRVWDSTIKPADRDTYGWNANPWVWVIEFERCEKEAADD